ncbi:Rhodanese-related sulfurtransferase [Candidatus Terasakiella magnetica]|uniref:Rhodanese-related sulfurtransferase n=1 Tax=Candidatus Terasakiella magnetica TaxID=1867952 RepID=A0A1C3RL67_9PROT|nr:rhodanese-like domain-containing protein [Candidatus Terasakiella magnetica]SCA57997.1 Rhodanese-related sulfurtransferase [Candidatus Terasakiella magnetica]
MRWLGLVVLLLSACAQTVPLPEGYRMNRYKAPVPNHVPGGRVLTVAQAKELHEKGSALFIDVIGSGSLLTEGIDGEWLRVRPRHSIPNSLWLPDVGRGALTPAQELYFSKSLKAITGDNKQKSLVFFCLKSCWMSWNAVKRAAHLGYENLYWFSQGSDGWGAGGHLLSEIAAYPRKATQ